MTITNAYKKLIKAGFTVLNVSGSFTAAHAASNRVIEFHRNGGSDNVTCIRSRRISDKDDAMSDYFAGSWHDNLTQAIKLVLAE
jgi:hypothetical protein